MSLLRAGDIVSTVTLELDGEPPLDHAYVQDTSPNLLIVRMLRRPPGAKRKFVDTDIDMVLPWAGLKQLIGSYDQRTGKIKYFNFKGKS